MISLKMDNYLKKGALRHTLETTQNGASCQTKTKEINKMTHCLYCNKKGHASYECWNKNKYLKEIRRNENGKLIKRYCPNYSTPKNSDFDEKERQHTKQKPRTRTESSKDNRVKSKSGPETQQVFLKAKPTRKLTHDNEIQIVQELKNKRTPKPLEAQPSNSSEYQKCQESIK